MLGSFLVVPSKRDLNYLRQCFSTFLLQKNLPQMFELLMEPYAMIQVSILQELHRTVVAIFVPGNFGLFPEPLAATRGNPVEKH